VSISLPGLAHFGCDLSATVGGIPDFGQAFRSRGSGHKNTREKRGLAWIFINQSRSLGWIHGLDRYLRRLTTGAFASTQNPATRNPSLLRKEWSFGPQFRMHRPVWRFGNSRAKEYRVRRTDRYIRLSDNLLLGRFGPPTLP
jgi:hypothetical protein